VTVGGGHAGGSAVALHFGLGDKVAADIRVIWPDGVKSGWMAAAVDSLVTVSRAAVQ